MGVSKILGMGQEWYSRGQKGGRAMKSQEQVDREFEELQEAFAEMCVELRAWRAAHPEASLDEIGEQVGQRRRGLMGALMGVLAQQEGDGREATGSRCACCGQELAYKGQAKREVQHLEGEVGLERAYYHCPKCGQGFFPPG